MSQSSSTALLVVDAQESFRHRPYWNGQDAERFVERAQALIDGAAARGIPVVQIRCRGPANCPRMRWW